VSKLLRTEFENLKMQSRETIYDYFSRVKTTSNQMKRERDARVLEE